MDTPAVVYQYVELRLGVEISHALTLHTYVSDRDVDSTAVPGDVSGVRARRFAGTLSDAEEAGLVDEVQEGLCHRR